MPRRPRRAARPLALAAALAGLALPLAAAVPASAMPAGAHAAGQRTVVLRYYDKPVDLVLTHADGTVVANPTVAPVAGDVLDILSLDYRGTRAHHAARATASAHTRCVFAAAGPPACVGHVAIGGDLLVFTGDTFTSGTGRFRGATGSVVSSAVSERDNSANLKATLVLRSH